MNAYRSSPAVANNKASETYTALVNNTPQKTIFTRGYFSNNFNNSVIIGNRVSGCPYLFGNCSSLNRPITIGRNVIDCEGMFRNCNRFDQNIVIPKNVQNCQFMFDSCSRLSFAIKIPQNAKNCAGMFKNCYNIGDLDNMVIPSGTENCYTMFFNALNVSGNIYIKGTPNCKSMFGYGGGSRSYQVNIFCNNIEVITNNDYGILPLNAWTEIENGFRNASSKLYAYYNYSG